MPTRQRRKARSTRTPSVNSARGTRLASDAAARKAAKREGRRDTRWDEQ